MDKKFSIPGTFSISKRAPSIEEMNELWNWLYGNYNKKIDKVLEFGCGVTTWVINDSLDPKEYICMEQFEPCISAVKKHVNKVQFITSDWSGIPKKDYNLVFVDSCTAPPKGLKPLKCANPFRDDAINYVKDFISKDSIIIIHDWNHPREAWKTHRRYLENNNYKLIWSFCKNETRNFYGLGAYKKGK